MARGNSRAASELPPSLEQRAKQAIKNAPEDAEYLNGLTPFDWFYESKNVKDVEYAINDYFDNFDVLDAKYKVKGESPAYEAFRKQVQDALEDAKSDGSELVTRGSFNRGWEQDEVWNGSGKSSEYTTVLKAKGAPSIEIKWRVEAYTDDDRDGGSKFKADIRLNSIKIR